MFELLSYGEKLLSMLAVVGDWLMYTPETLNIWLPFVEEVVNVPNPFGSIAEMIFGGGIIFILGFRLVKFFTDIVL